MDLQLLNYGALRLNSMILNGNTVNSVSEFGDSSGAILNYNGATMTINKQHHQRE